MTDYVTSADGTRIGYDRYGSGPALIMVGGAFQHRAIDPDTSDLSYQLGSRGFTVINYDRRGRGDSRGPGTVAANTLADELADLEALIAVAGGEAALYGSSSGSAISLAAAVSGLPVTALVLWEPPLGTLSPEAQSPAEFHAELVELIAGDDPEAAIRYFMKDMPPEWVTGAEQSPMWPVMVEVGPSLAGDADAMAWFQATDTERLLAPIEVGVHVLIGQSSLPGFEQAADRISAALPQAVSVRVPGADHRWEIDPLRETIVAFLRPLTER